MLLDGDKIATLAAVYLRQLLSHAPAGTADSINPGVVQTAYANGASTRFFTQALGLQVRCTNTGEQFILEATLGVTALLQALRTLLLLCAAAHKMLQKAHRGPQGCTCWLSGLAASKLPDNLYNDALTVCRWDVRGACAPVRQ